MFKARTLPAILAAGMMVGSLGLPAYARGTVADLMDVRVDHWAFAALQTVIDKYAIAIDGVLIYQTNAIRCTGKAGVPYADETLTTTATILDAALD